MSINNAGWRAAYMKAEFQIHLCNLAIDREVEETEFWKNQKEAWVAFQQLIRSKFNGEVPKGE